MVARMAMRTTMLDWLKRDPRAGAEIELDGLTLPIVIRRLPMPAA